MLRVLVSDSGLTGVGSSSTAFVEQLIMPEEMAIAKIMSLENLFMSEDFEVIHCAECGNNFARIVLWERWKQVL